MNAPNRPLRGRARAARRVAVAVLATATGALCLLWHNAGEERPASPSGPSGPSAPPLAESQVPASAPLPARSTSPRPADGHSPRVAVPRHGYVVDIHGVAVPGVRIGPEDPQAHPADVSETDGDGRFVLPGLPTGTRLLAVDVEWITVQPVRIHPGHDPTLIVARSIELAGRVIDAAGKPVADALLALELPSEPIPGPSGVLTRWLALSDAEGAFVFPRAPGIPGLRMVTQHDGHRRDERSLPAGNQNQVTVQLVEAPPPRWLQGTVSTASGSPLPRAQVCCGGVVVSSDPRGAFALPLPEWSAATASVLAFATGFQPLALPLPARGEALETPLAFVLQPAQPLRGRVLTANGQPLANWCVALADPTPLDPARPHVAYVEDQIGAARMQTDATGAFRFEGAFARPYTIDAWDEHGRRATRRLGALAADGMIDLVVGPWNGTSLHGTVTTADGQPVVGATVGPERLGVAGRIGADAMQFGHRAITGADGSFALALPDMALNLLVDGPDIVPARRALDLAPSPSTPITWAVQHRPVVRCTGPAELLADLDFVALDAAGRDGSSAESNRGAVEAPSASGRGAATPPRAEWLLLQRRGAHLGRLRLPANLTELQVHWSAPTPAYSPDLRQR